MWVITRRAKYYTVMADTVWEALCRMETAEGKKPPDKLGEAATHAEAGEMVRQMKKREQEVRNADGGEVRGCQTGGGEKSLEKGNRDGEPAAGNETCVSGHADGTGAGNATAKPGRPAAEPPALNRMDAGQDGLLPAEWAQEDVMVTAREGGDGMPVFTGEVFLRKWPRESKIIVNLRFAHGFTIADIAKVVGCSPQTVSNVCRTEMSSRPAGVFRKAMADRLRGTAHNLLMLVDERVGDQERMSCTETKELVTLLEKVCSSLRLMEGAEGGEGETPPSKPKETRSAEELAAADMEEISGVYQKSLGRTGEGKE